MFNEIQILFSFPPDKFRADWHRINPLSTKRQNGRHHIKLEVLHYSNWSCDLK